MTKPDEDAGPRLTRRALIAGAGGAALAAPLLAQEIDLGLPGGPSLRPLSPSFPGKGDMIVQRIRPPLLETPMEAFREGTITPNDRMFVRWNWDMQTSINAAAHRRSAAHRARRSARASPLQPRPPWRARL